MILIKLLKKTFVFLFGYHIWLRTRTGVVFLLRNIYVPIFGWKSWNKIYFYFYHGYRLNLDCPKTFLEKLQWQKYYGNIESYSKYVDKYELRKYIFNILESQYLVPLIGIFNKPTEINYNNLPNRFALKATHGSGWSIIVKDKNKINWNDSIHKMNKWLSINYYKRSGEVNYMNIKPRIIIEDYIDEPSGNLIDYKLWCFNGIFHFIGVHGDKSTVVKAVLLDHNWSPINIEYPDIPKWKTLPKKPENLNDLIAVAEKLASGFPFVRVDLYSVNNRIIFGELTFTPGDGFNIIFPYDLDLYYGDLMPLTFANTET
jgi:hypothetical protein